VMSGAAQRSGWCGFVLSSGALPPDPPFARLGALGDLSVGRISEIFTGRAEGRKDREILWVLPHRDPFRYPAEPRDRSQAGHDGGMRVQRHSQDSSLLPGSRRRQFRVTRPCWAGRAVENPAYRDGKISHFLR
jgi:hypothetical protein